MKLIISSAAVADLQRLRAFLEEKSETAAQRAATALTQAIESLAAFPDRGRPSGAEDVRELIVPFGASAYIIRYFHKPGADELLVLRVWHGREER